MTVYAKLTKARGILSETKMKKSGKNKFAGYEYFELGDFIPHIHKIFDQVGLCGVFSFDSEKNAILTIYDSAPSKEPNQDNFITFASPVVPVNNPKGQPIQDLGSTHTYMRRYLWLMAMEIVENDSVDADKKEEKEKKEEEDPNNALFVKKICEWAAECESLESLMSIWKDNLTAIHNLKKNHPKHFEQLQSRFAEYKAKF
jgi:hypothetical protein